ncbi:MAG: CinA family nicotinamide mononucleotide deamidase-related protein [Candidatus Neomarinimicrobiota bacterium]
MKAGILTVGDELLDGVRVDTNSVWLAQRLLERGASIGIKASVGDEVESIAAMLGSWDGELDLVITTGGLGPTHDDVTIAAFCRYFQCGLEFDEDYWQELVTRFRKRGLDIADNNRSQAEIPEKADALPNSVGTAPGLKFQSPATTFYVVPGVPAEMKAIMTEHVLPTLDQTGGVAWVTLHTTGVMESELAARIHSLIEGNDGVRVAYLPGVTGVDIRLKGVAVGSEGREAVEGLAANLEAELGQLVYGRDETTLEAAVGRLLAERGESVAFAESCSGGLAMSRTADVPGASAYLRGGVVAYSNEVKVAQLQVGEETLKTHGAVSEAVGREMAEGVRSRFEADWGVATTGIAGPGGGTAEKPVGLVFLAVAGPKRTVALEARLIPERLAHKAASTQAALNLLRLELSDYD